MLRCQGNPPLINCEFRLPGWRLVYAVDSTGARLSGDKAVLLAAVRSGQPIRVGWGVAWKLPDGTAGGVEHVAEAAFLTIHQGEVFAQMPPMLGQTPKARAGCVGWSAQSSLSVATDMENGVGIARNDAGSHDPLSS